MYGQYGQYFSGTASENIPNHNSPDNIDNYFDEVKIKLFCIIKMIFQIYDHSIPYSTDHTSYDNAHTTNQDAGPSEKKNKKKKKRFGFF